MELKVNVDGVERSVSGLTESTTCAQIIYALAHATGQKGRFVLVEKFRDAERSLAPTDRPLEMLKKWDQHSQQVSFVLKHLDSCTHTSAVSDPSSSDAQSSCTSTATQSSSGTHKMALPFASERSCTPEMQAATNEPIAQSSRFSGNFAAHRITTSSSTGCMRSVLPDELHTFEAYPSWQRQQSLGSSYFAAAQTASLRNRPPPPAYHEVIERRYNSLTRGTTNSLPRHHSAFHSTDHSYNHDSVSTRGSQSPVNGVVEITQEMNLSAADLERLIRSQQRTIEQQKARLAQLDNALNDDDLREIIQLERQQANLRLVLNPLRALDWPARLQTEKLKVEQIGCAIAELQRKIDSLTSEVREKTILEMKITEQIQTIQREIFNIESGIMEEDDEHDPQLGLLAS